MLRLVIFPLLLLPALAAADEQLDGVWRSIGFEEDGTEFRSKAARSQMPCKELWVKDERVILVFEDKGAAVKAAIRPNAKPREIDVHWEGGKKTQHGIYAIDCDTLRLSWAAIGKERPKSLETKPGDGRFILLFKRKP